jgi:hypothetical protein
MVYDNCNKWTASDANRRRKDVFMYCNRALAHHLPVILRKCSACSFEIRLPTVYVSEDVPGELTAGRGCDEGLWCWL